MERLLNDRRFAYARLYNVPPHDPALNHISDFDLDVFIEAAFAFDAVLRGKPYTGAQGSLADRIAKFQKRLEKRAKEQQPVTPKELGWEEEPHAGY